MFGTGIFQQKSRHRFLTDIRLFVRWCNEIFGWGFMQFFTALLTPMTSTCRLSWKFYCDTILWCFPPRSTSFSWKSSRCCSGNVGKCQEISLGISRLTSIARHDALILFRSSLSSPTLLYTLQCFTFMGNPLLLHFGQLHCAQDCSLAIAQEQWLAASGAPLPSKTLLYNHPLVMKDMAAVEASITTDYHRARLKAVASPHSGDWLLLLPVSVCGLRLNDEAVRIATGLRLGIDLCASHECPCGAIVQADGSHGMSCSLGPGRTARHALQNTS